MRPCGAIAAAGSSAASAWLSACRGSGCRASSSPTRRVPPALGFSPVIPFGERRDGRVAPALDETAYRMRRRVETHNALALRAGISAKVRERKVLEVFKHEQGGWG